MKKFIYTFILMQIIAASVFAQTPQAVCYQAVAADATGVSLVEQDITVRTSILLNTPTGTEQWIETHNVTTDEFGLFTLDVGRGTPAGGSAAQFDDIDWGNGTYFLKVELDIAGGNDFSFMGTNQILSVPYAIHAESANVANTALFANTSDTALVSQVAMTTLGDDDGDPTNEIQMITFENNMLSISGGNEIPFDVSDADADPLNEIQTIDYQDNVLSISGGNEIPLDIRDEDADPVNEIQTLTFEDNTLSISGEGGNAINFGDMVYGGPGASIDFPQGIMGEHIIKTMGQYQVPDDKIFYITAGGPSIKLLGYGGSGVYEHANTPNMPILPSGTIISDCMCTGLLVSPVEDLDAVIVDLSDASYTVPANTVFFLKSGLTNSNTSYLNINNVEMEFLRPNFTRGTRTITFPAGTLIKKSTTATGELVLTGYLVNVSNQP